MGKLMCSFPSERKGLSELSQKIQKFCQDSSLLASSFILSPCLLLHFFPVSLSLSFSFPLFSPHHFLLILFLLLFFLHPLLSLCHWTGNGQKDVKHAGPGPDRPQWPLSQRSPQLLVAKHQGQLGGSHEDALGQRRTGLKLYVRFCRRD